MGNQTQSTRDTVLLLLDQEILVRKGKPKQCAWCGESIEGKSIAHWRQYQRDGKTDGDYMHTECRDAMNIAYGTADACGWKPGRYPRGGIVKRFDIVT